MDLLEARSKFGDVFQITFEDNTKVVFRLLSFQEYEHFQSLYLQGLIDRNDRTIYDKCVIIDNSDDKTRRAGIFYTVTNIVLFLSGPSSIADWQNGLEEARKNINHIVAQTEMIICQAFPSYKPEDIWCMSWPTIMNRLAQAEAILIDTNLLKQPIKILDQQERKSIEELIREGKDIQRIDRATPVGEKHPIGRESHWDNIKESNPRRQCKR